MYYSLKTDLRIALAGETCRSTKSLRRRLQRVRSLRVSSIHLGALVGLRLANRVCSALEIPFNAVKFWVDIQDIGYWIQGKSREYKPFVAQRVGEIHENSNPDQWRYVPTSLNPADLGTRGMTALELVKSMKWWNGPDFLHCPEINRRVRSNQRPDRFTRVQQVTMSFSYWPTMEKQRQTSSKR